LSALFNLLSFI
jgi:hypothetical protein